MCIVRSLIILYRSILLYITHLFQLVIVKISSASLVYAHYIFLLTDHLQVNLKFPMKLLCSRFKFNFCGMRSCVLW
jgi:hypothetical protein